MTRIMKNSSCLLGSYNFCNRVKFLLIAHKIKSQKVYGESKWIENLEYFFKEGQTKIFGHVVIRTGKFEKRKFTNCF